MTYIDVESLEHDLFIERYWVSFHNSMLDSAYTDVHIDVHVECGVNSSCHSRTIHKCMQYFISTRTT